MDIPDKPDISNLRRMRDETSTRDITSLISFKRFRMLPTGWKPRRDSYFPQSSCYELCGKYKRQTRRWVATCRFTGGSTTHVVATFRFSCYATSGRRMQKRRSVPTKPWLLQRIPPLLRDITPQQGSVQPLFSQRQDSNSNSKNTHVLMYFWY